MKQKKKNKKGLCSKQKNKAKKKEKQGRMTTSMNDAKKKGEEPIVARPHF